MNINRIIGINFLGDIQKPYSYNTQVPQKEAPQKSFFTTKNLLIAGAGAAAIAVAGIAIYRRRKLQRTNNDLENIIITGKAKVKDLVSKFTHDDYDASKVFKINLHIHSTASDGKMTPLEILRQAKTCADKLPKGEKFTFSLTDHDTIAGVQEINNAIKKDPKKYSNLIFIPGIEMSTSYSNPKTLEGAVNIDYLIYGFDVNNKRLISEINRRRNALKSATEALFKDINQKAGKDLLTLENAQKFGNEQLRYIGSNGYIPQLNDYVQKTVMGNSAISPEAIQALFIKHFGSNKQALFANIATTDAAKLASEINAFSSIAHPGKIHYANAKLLCPDETVKTDMINSILSAGGDGIECHYMAYNGDASFGELHGWQKIREIIKSLDIPYSRTGGYDCHGTSITSKH